MRFASFGVTAVMASSLAAGCAPDPFTVVVSVRDADLVAYRDGDGEWKPVEVGGNGRASLRITEGRYSLAWICDDDFWTRSYVLHSTLDDEPRAHCFGGSSGAATLYGQTEPNATIYTGGSQTVADGLGNYSVFVSPPGYHDVVLVTSEAQPRVMIERNVDLRADQQLDVPFDARAASLEMSQPAIFGPPQDVTLTSELYTTNGDHVVFPPGGEIVPIVPASLLLETDWQIVRAQGTACSQEVRVRGETPTLELPEKPVAMLDRAGMSWSSEVEWNRVRVDLSNDDSEYSVTATRAWIDEADAGGVQFPDLTALPGWSSGFRAATTLGLTGYQIAFEHGSRASTFTACTVNDGAAF